MTLEKLKEIFRFQTTATNEFTPDGTLSYILFEPHRSPQPFTKKDTELEQILEHVKGFEHDGFRDKVPTFVKTEPV